MNYLNYSYTRLKEIGLVSTMNQFSTDWLLRSESYARSYVCRQKDLTLPTMIILTARIDKTANSILGSNIDTGVGTELKELSEELAVAIYNKALQLK